MEDFKVSVETLHTTKVKEINYEGEETYQEYEMKYICIHISLCIETSSQFLLNLTCTLYSKPSLSKKLSELAQRMDFNEEDDETSLEEDSTNPSAKKSSRRWPWEYTHSKLK